MIRLIDVKHKLGILQDVHPEAQRQTAQRERNGTFQKTCAARRPEATSSTEIRRLPVGFPDVQRVRVRDAPLVRLLLQEVKEVFDGQGGAFRRDAEDGLEEVIQELLQSPLWRRRTERAVEILQLVPEANVGHGKRRQNDDSDVGRPAAAPSVHLGRQQARQVDFRQDLLAVALPV